MTKVAKKRGDDDFDEAGFWKAEAKRIDEQRQRVARTLLALRAVKSMERYPESAIRYVTMELLNLPYALANDLEGEDEQMIRKIICVEVWRILERFDAKIDATDGGALTPLNARFLQLEGELQHGDITLPK